MLSNVINEIEEFRRDVAVQLHEALNNLPEPGEPPGKVNLSLSLTMPDMSELDEEMLKLERYYGIHSDEFDGIGTITFLPSAKHSL